MAQQHTLSLIEVGARERTVMRSLLNLAGAGEGRSAWQLSEQGGGALTIVDVDSEAGAQAWQALVSEGSTPVALTRCNDFPAEKVLRKPLRPRAFLDLLDAQAHAPVEPAAEAGPDQAAATLTLEPVQWLGMEMPSDPEHLTLAEHLRCGTWRVPVVLQADGWPALIIDSGSGSWYVDGSLPDLSPEQLSEPLPASAGRPVSSEELAQRSARYGRRSLGELKWYAGLAQSRGRLHPDLLGPFQFMLAQAPAEAMSNERFAALARILIRGPLGLEELHECSGEPPANIAAFLNACHTTGRLLIDRPARAASGF